MVAVDPGFGGSAKRESMRGLGGGDPSRVTMLGAANVPRELLSSLSSHNINAENIEKEIATPPGEGSSLFDRFGSRSLKAAKLTTNNFKSESRRVHAAHRRAIHPQLTLPLSQTRTALTRGPDTHTC